MIRKIDIAGMYAEGAPLGTCDWGDCDELAAALRYFRTNHGWLPVCDRHTRTIDEEDPAAPIRVVPLEDA